MAYEVVMPYHLHMPSYFLGTFTEYPMPMTRPFPPEETPVPFHRNENFPLRKLKFPLRETRVSLQETPGNT